MTPTGKQAREDSVRVRDAALRRISLMRRWMILAAAGLTAAFAWLVSAVLPGKSLGAKATTSAPRSTATAGPITPALPAPASAAQLGVGSPGQSQPSIAPPPAAPQPAPSVSTPAPSGSAPAPAPSGAVSGGS